MAFRKNEQLPVSNSRKQREPKLFVLFLEVKEKMTKYCNEKIEEGNLSAENVAVEVKYVII